MKKSFLLSILSALLVCYGFSQDPGWPRQLTNNGSVLVLYTPQVENWTNYQAIDFRMAFTLTPDQGKKVVGVLYIHALTENNTNNHTVKIYDMQVKDVHFPSLDDATASSMGQIVRSFLNAGKTVTVSLERIVACTPKTQNSSTAVTVNNNPPTTFVSTTPAILLQLEGQPGMGDATPGGIKYVFNANWPLFFDPNTSTYFLYDDHEWQSSAAVSGPWSFNSTLPPSLIQLASDPHWSSLLQGAIPATAWTTSAVPKIFYATTPAEIILFQGSPDMASIPGTRLSYATNTNNNVFFSSANSQYYYLAAGRWFSAPDLNGPWTYATPSLPSDFANIPLSSPAARVLSAVPGTDEAADAVMIAQIPTKQKVDPASAPAVTITYSGDPKFAVIGGTTLYYAENTSDKVIMTGNNQYYACISGVWYAAASPQGPWTVAGSVPQVIYTIPSSSPVYNVTFVTQTTGSDGAIQASYTAGYMGVYVVGGGATLVVASGTGFYYPPYMYYPPAGFPVCYASVTTYGAYAYHPYSYYGGAVSYGASYNAYTGTYARSATAYGPYGSASAGQSYNPTTGTYARGATETTPYGTRSAARAYNPYTGASATTHQGSDAYGQAGTSTYNNGHGTTTETAHATNNYGQTETVAANSNGAEAKNVSGANGSATVAKSADGDMYASKDGNVYSKSGGSWSQVNNTKTTTAPATSGYDQSAAKSSANYSTAQSDASRYSSNYSSADKSSASQSGAYSKPSGGSAPSSEMSSAASDRSRGDAGSGGWGGSGSRSGGGGGGGGWGGGGGGRR